MKKHLIIITLLLAFFAGCANVQPQNTENANDVNRLDTEIQTEENETEAADDAAVESILISGLISEINDNMVTVVDAEGLGTQGSIVIKISNETLWNVPSSIMKVNQRITAEISPMMTRSIPPQSNAIKIVSLYDVILGEVVNVDDKSITIKPVTNVYNHEEVIMLIGDETIWHVEVDVVSAGSYIRVVADNKMTASIPPQVPCIEVLSVETHD